MFHVEHFFVKKYFPGNILMNIIMAILTMFHVEHC